MVERPVEATSMVFKRMLRGVNYWVLGMNSMNKLLNIGALDAGLVYRSARKVLGPRLPWFSTGFPVREARRRRAVRKVGLFAFYCS